MRAACNKKAGTAIVERLLRCGVYENASKAGVNRQVRVKISVGIVWLRINAVAIAVLQTKGSDGL